MLSWPSGCLRICTVQGVGSRDDEVVGYPSAPLPLLPRQLRSNPSFDPFSSVDPVLPKHRALTSQAQRSGMSLLVITPWSSLDFSVQHSQILSDDGIRNLSLSTWFDKSDE